MAILLHTALVKASQVGKSSSSVSTFSSNSKLDKSPSPFNVLSLILSGDKFLVNLQQIFYQLYSLELDWWKALVNY